MRDRRKLSVPCCCRRLKKAGESNEERPLLFSHFLHRLYDLHLEPEVLNHLPGFVRRHARRGKVTTDEERVGRIERQRLQGAEVEFAPRSEEHTSELQSRND